MDRDAEIKQLRNEAFSKKKQDITSHHFKIRLFCCVLICIVLLIIRFLEINDYDRVFEQLFRLISFKQWHVGLV